MNIEIDEFEFKRELTTYAAQKVVDNYFNANDVGNWDKREKESAKRIKSALDKIDWNNAPEGFSKAAAQQFFSNLMDKMK